jgi:hypothetical protein
MIGRMSSDNSEGRVLDDYAEMGGCGGKPLQKVLLRQFFHNQLHEPIDYLLRRFRIE